MAGDFELLTRATLLSAVRNPRHDADWQAAWKEFKEIYEGPIKVWALGMGMSPHDADELTQDVLIKLLERLKTFRYDPKKKFRHWLRRVVSTTVTDRWRDKKRKPGNWGTGDTAAQEALQEVADPYGSGFDKLLEELEIRLERGRLVTEACENVKRKVKEQTWKIFLMIILDGVAETEVAVKYGMKISAVYATKSRVLKMLREEIDRVRDVDE